MYAEDGYQPPPPARSRTRDGCSPSRPDVLERILHSPDAIALVHQEDEAIDGFVCGHDVGFRAYLSELVVAPSWQGRGVGSRLVSELEQRLAERGCGVLIADLWRDAERFYRSLGWTSPEVVLLRKRLASPWRKS
jgi:GNAT superfamily N-acetyltransferase